jgi:cytochrome c-type biogenesis protein
MQYALLFLEGIITFVSPCLLPLLPVYLSYFTGESGGRAAAFRNAACFVAGFAVVFSIMGAFAGALGGLLRHHRTAINVVSGAIVVILGLNFLGLLSFDLSSPFGRGRSSSGPRRSGPVASAVFGMTFAIVWTPCVGIFLGSALMMASTHGSVAKGVSMLMCYSLGLGVPFLASAVLIDALKSAFALIKSNYKVVNVISGSLLVVLGVLMMTGIYGRWVLL